MEQYAVKKFAESLESVPRALAENAGMKVRDLVPAKPASFYIIRQPVLL